ncbi:hypothetical protein WIS52_17155 [Pseudonocardia nematodicida]|uniref:Uncharacterized protein n=1 Tax=Pseudonocardia nematodicida TaxID=1206997 RepID=A0ABV1KD11_9PSEU
MISDDATPLFQTKINQITQAHWAHHEELLEATDRLREAARHYGLIEDEVTDTLRHTNSGPMFRGHLAEG